MMDFENIIYKAWATKRAMYGYLNQIKWAPFEN